MQQLAHVGTFADSPALNANGVADFGFYQPVGAAVLFTVTVTEVVQLNAFSVAMDGTLSLFDTIELPFEPMALFDPNLQVITGSESGGVLRVSGLDIAGVTQVTLAANGSFGVVAIAETAITSQAQGRSVAVTVDGDAALCALDSVTGYMRLWSLNGDGSSGNSYTYAQPDWPFLTDVAAIKQTADDIVLAVSAEADALMSFKIDANGAFVKTDFIDPATDFWVSNPSVVEAVSIGETAFAIVASAGGSTLTVVQVGHDGALTITDHIMDALNTRFAGAQVLGVTEHEGRAFVAAAGSDDGITLFELLQNGQLLELDTIADQMNTTLDNVSSMHLEVQGDQLIVFVGSASEVGVTVLIVPMTHGVTLSGTSGKDTLTGGDGDDVFLDSGGADKYFGGAGADVFIFSDDGARNIIHDFDAKKDRIDISHWSFLRSLDDVSYTQKTNGAEVRFNDELLRIVTVDKHALTWEEFLKCAGLSGARLLPTWTFPLIEPDSDPEPVPDDDPNVRILSGTNGADLITGGLSNDIIFGFAGGDTLRGLAGTDTIHGGAGHDGIKGNAGSDVIKGDDGNDIIFGGIGWDEISGGDGDDWIRGDDGFDFISGDAGDDTIWGNNGNDTVHGEHGNDIVDGGLGADTLYGGDGDDRIDGKGGPDVIYGGAGDDVLSGNAWFDTLFGGNGDDILSGGITNDVLYGGDGADVLYGNNGFDHLYGGGRDDTLYGNAGFDTLYGDRGNDVLSGGYHHDELFGGRGHDVLYGDSGSDTLSGGAGNDLLFGGTGPDVFIFTAGHDQITDFFAMEDSLILDTALWGGGAPTLTEFKRLEGVPITGGVQLDFGGDNTLEVIGVATLTDLFDSIEWL